MTTLTASADISVRRNIASDTTEEHEQTAQRAVEPTAPITTTFAVTQTVIDLSLWKSDKQQWVLGSVQT